MLNITKNLGCYDFCNPHKKSWLVSVTGLPEGAPSRGITQTWAEDDEPDIEDLLPSELIEIISDKVESYLFSTSREKDREVIRWARDNADRLNKEWIAQLIERKTKQIEKLEREIKELKGREVVE